MRLLRHVIKDLASRVYLARSKHTSKRALIEDITPLRQVFAARYVLRIGKPTRSNGTQRFALRVRFFQR